MTPEPPPFAASTEMLRLALNTWLLQAFAPAASPPPPSPSPSPSPEVDETPRRRRRKRA
jgi:hypothetical protein